MIPIDNTKLAVPADWQALADEKTADLWRMHRAGTSRDDRNQFIEDNGHVWRDSRIKNELLRLSHGKCWFTEARDKVSDWQVEHFRPKKEAWDLDKNGRDGYWWRSFDPTNFRICGAVTNRPKACYFPLMEGSTPGSPDKPKCRGERPVFLDPTVDWDVSLITFDSEGKFVARKTAGAVDRERVRVTAEKFRLNEHQPLVEWRQDVWEKSCELIAGILSDQRDVEAGEGAANAEGARDAKLQSLKKLTDEKSEFAGVARAAVMKSFPDLLPILLRP